MGGRPIHRIWCTSDLRSTPKFFQLLKDQKASGVLVEEVSWSRLGQLTNGAVHQGIVLQIAASKTHDLKNLIEACKAFGDSSLLLALDGLTDPQNLGAIIRSAEALGAQGLIRHDTSEKLQMGPVVDFVAINDSMCIILTGSNRMYYRLGNLSSPDLLATLTEGKIVLDEIPILNKIRYPVDGNLITIDGAPHLIISANQDKLRLFKINASRLGDVSSK